MHVHRRQFVLGPVPWRACDDWISVELTDRRYLSYCPTLEVARRSARTLIGIVVETDPGRPDPSSSLLDEPTLRTSGWAGRWVLIDGNTVELDATGSLGVFYRLTGDGLWVSSSPELLRVLEPVLALPAITPVHAKGVDWFPPPSSGIPGIARLLPSQTLGPDGRVEYRPLFPTLPDLPYNTALETLESQLVSAMTALAGRFEKIWLPLSGGRDSRLLLAAARASGIVVTTYTFDSSWLARADRTLPPALANLAGYEHHLIGVGVALEGDLDVVDRHTARHLAGVDRLYIAQHQWDSVPADGVVLGGGVFEVGRCYFYGILPRDLPPTPQETAAAIQQSLPSVVPEGVRLWTEWLHETIESSYDWRDRFYVEQRVGGWLSTIGQATDLVASRVHIASCADYLAATLSLPEEIRRKGTHHDDLICRLAPDLMKLPINPPDSFAERVGKRLSRELAILKAQGGAGYAAKRARDVAARVQQRKA